MVRGVSCAVALGISFAFAGGNRIEDELSLLQGMPQAPQVPGPLSAIQLTADLVPLAIAQFSADVEQVAEASAAEVEEVLALRRAVPSSLKEFSATAPNRYTHIGYEVEYHTLGEEVISFPMRKPRSFNLMMATCKTWLADLVVQLAERRAKGGADGIDWRRSLAFAAFGFFYVGLVQWVLYVTVMTDLCPNAIAFSNEPLSLKLHNFPGQIDLAKQVVIDNCFFAVMIYFPVFYTVKEIMNGSTSPFSDAMKKYRSNFFSDNAASMAFWIPGDFIAFAAPIFLRLPLDHGVSFIWTMYLSFKRGSSTSATQSKGT